MIDLDLCPRCGEFVDALDECTGWCESCHPRRITRFRPHGPVTIGITPLVHGICLHCMGPIYSAHPLARYCSKAMCQQEKRKATAKRYRKNHAALAVARHHQEDR